MFDQSRPPSETLSEPGTLPNFTPVPRHYARHDGWTPARQRGFIAALAETGSVKSAAHAVNMTPEGAYLLRRHPPGRSVPHRLGSRPRARRAAAGRCRASRFAQQIGIFGSRALHGIEVPVYGYGQIIGTRRVYNDKLLMFLLRNRAPHRFSKGQDAVPDAVARQQLDRLKKQWRAEWEAERAAQDQKDEAEILASIDAKIAQMEAREAETAALLQKAAQHATHPPEEPDIPRPTPEQAAQLSARHHRPTPPAPLEIYHHEPIPRLAQLASAHVV